MFALLHRSPVILSSFTLIIGAIGAALGFAISLPMFILSGPAILVTLLGLAGVPLKIHDPLRNAAFLLIGIGLGAGVDAEATAAFLRWPLAFVALALMLLAILIACRTLLGRLFGYDRETAILASSPGHLSYVLGLGDAFDVNVALISVVQSVRILSLTLIVPLVATLLGSDLTGAITQPGPYMGWVNIAALIAAAGLLSLVLRYFKVPAALLIAGMLVTTVTHVSEIITGTMPPVVALPCFAIVGTLIGTRFSGISMAMLRQGLMAGLSATVVALICALVAAWPVALFLDMPLSHVVVAFAPGGLETMIAMGIVLGANPGFIAACHVGRLFILTLLVPALLGLRRR